jgi:hypothetical protein
VGAQGQMTEPDVINYADWDGKATTTSSYMPASLWTDHQRLHQYLGGHNTTYGNATLNIDADALDVNLGGTGPQLQPGFRIAIGMNSNGTAEWFARAANGTILHAYQRPIGATTWAPTRTVGNSPANLISNPAISSDSDGALTLFAVSKGGQVVHAWQQANGPNGWEWGGAIGTGSPGSIAGDPAAIQEPGGAVGVFVTDSSGAVTTTQQQAANDNTGWTRWTSIGGSCASVPVPFTQSDSVLAVACVTRAGTLAVATTDGEGGSGWLWSGWQQVGQLSGLTGTPAVAITSAGQVDVFAATASGQVADAYLDPAGAGQQGPAWIDGASLPGSSTATGSPAAIAWPGGGVAVFSQLVSGQVGYTVTSAGQGSLGGWAPWSSLGAATLGSPTAWLDSSGEPQAAILNAQRKLAVTGYASDSWTSWTAVADGF